MHRAGVWDACCCNFPALPTCANGQWVASSATAFRDPVLSKGTWRLACLHRARTDCFVSCLNEGCPFSIAVHVACGFGFELCAHLSTSGARHGAGKAREGIMAAWCS